MQGQEHKNGQWGQLVYLNAKDQMDALKIFAEDPREIGFIIFGNMVQHFFHGDQLLHVIMRSRVAPSQPSSHPMHTVTWFSISSMVTGPFM